LQNQLDSANASYNRFEELPIFVEKEIVTEIEINAAPSRVWQVLTDFEKYPIWNPFIKKITGIPAKNELELIPYLYNRKKWTGWDDLNPRPQQQFVKLICFQSRK
jgi:Polyketide cyclase / dehydrase and lipid transport